MIAEISAAVSSVRALSDLVKANKSLAHFNELGAAVSEVTANLLSAQAAALASQKSEMMLSDRVRDLEKEIMELKDWNREAERYQLCTFTIGIFTYGLKEGMENGEPSHHLCANCFTDKKKSILQFGMQGSVLRGYCPCCKGQIAIANKDAARYFPELRQK